MSRKEELIKQFPEFNITLMDIFSKMDISGRNKYLGLMCKVFQTDLASSKPRVLDAKNKGIANMYATPMEQKFAAVLLDTYIKTHFEVLNKFMEFNENNALEQNDVYKYSNMDQVKKAVELAQLKKDEKNLEKQIVKIHDDNEWLIIRPLSWNASSKYGSSTKWCTTFTNDKSYFLKYSQKGPLIYVLNKLTGYKVAFHKDLTATDMAKKVTTIWDDKDIQIDFITLALPNYIMNVIINELKYPKSNWDLTDSDTRKMVEKECSGKTSLSAGDSIFDMDVNDIFGDHIARPTRPSIPTTDQAVADALTSYALREQQARNERARNERVRERSRLAAEEMLRDSQNSQPTNIEQAIQNNIDNEIKSSIKNRMIKGINESLIKYKLDFDYGVDLFGSNEASPESGEDLHPF